MARRERGNHLRYPGLGLCPFVLDTRGAWGKEARAFVASVTVDMEPTTRAHAVKTCRQSVSTALQLAVADQLLSSAQGVVRAGPAARPGAAPATARSARG